HGHAVPVVQVGVVGDVGGEPANHVDAAGHLEHLLVDLDQALAVPVPSQPARVGRIKVDAHVGQGEGLDGVGRRFDVHVFRLGALREVHVGDQITQRIWLKNDHDGQVGMGLEVPRYDVDELGPVAGGAVLRNLQLSSRGIGGTVAVGQ